MSVDGDPSHAAGIRIIDRRTGEVEREVVMAEAAMRRLYGPSPAAALARAFLNKRPLSILYGLWQSSRFTGRGVRRFCTALGIDPAEAALPLESYPSMNAFFSRELRPGARPFDPRPEVLCSPADARVLVFPKLRGQRLPVKGGSYPLRNLLADDALAARFRGGAVCVLRLAPPDYHRFHFPDSGVAGSTRWIRGGLESVNPHATDRIPDLHCRNERAVTLLESAGFGTIALVEVGALLVGKIVQTYRPGRARRGDEKGYFRFGASTVILVLEPGRVTFDADLLAGSERGFETKLRAGEGIGRAPAVG